MNEQEILKLADEMRSAGAIVIPNGTTIEDWLAEGDLENVANMTIDELVAEWNEDL